MTEAFTSYEVDNDRKFRNAIKEASTVSQDLRVPFGLILRDFYKSQQAIFKLKGPGKYPKFKNSEGGYEQVSYSSLSDKRERSKRTFVDKTKSPYQRWKLKKYGFDYPLLFRTGALANSTLGPNNRGSVSIITKLALVFGSTIKYGIYHQSDNARSKIPLRKFLFIGPEAAEFATSEQMGRLVRWTAILNTHITQQLKKAGLNAKG